MTEAIAQQLCLRKSRNNMCVTGIDQCKVQSSGVVEARIKSMITTYNTTLQFVVVPKITGQLPSTTINMKHLKLPKHVVLADPSFGVPGRIDILLGQEIFLDLLCIGQIKNENMPTVQKTRLGWIVGGKYPNTRTASNSSISSCLLSTTNDRVDKQLQAFWQLEETVEKQHLTTEELTCEAHYAAHTSRDETGRYIVSMPLKEETSTLGDSRKSAERRLEQVERRLTRDSKLKKMYTDFMAEYIQLGHMEEVEPQETTTENSTEYFLPHHPIIKEGSSTTKLRVVFDASAKTSTGKSLNEIQLVGPTVQSDLFSLMLRFRKFNYVFTADLEKMYRQIRIEPSQSKLLQILWRENPLEPVKVYQLKTVTYGTASAPYLATRTLNQLAVDESDAYPEASTCVKRDFYVDDLITGTNTLQEGLELQNQLIQLLAKGHFNLRKWNSNSEEILSHLPEDLLERKPQEFSSTTDSTKKTLGLWWDAERDVFLFKHAPSAQGFSRLTKRVVLSEIARLFDPLGLVSPVIVRAKLYLQEMWKLQLGWDESLPMHMLTQWSQFLVCLNKLNYIDVKRQVTLPDPQASLELHGFSDASERAYGGAVYLRSIDATNNVRVTLLCAKSRVAPLKTVSLPRLELCAALLLSDLTSRVIKALEINPKNVTYWTDSTVTLAWISAEPARWTTFVANRVSKIQEATHQGEWKHVGTEDNPADYISRGTRATTLSNSNLWWEGPAWLQKEGRDWPNYNPIDIDIPEEKSTKITFITCTQESHFLNTVINRHSSFRKMTRVLSYCLRFVNNIRNKPEFHLIGVLKVQELQTATVCILKYVQQQEFHTEYNRLQRSLSPSNGKLASLNPFLDKDGLIRVGGRLERSNLEYDQKHQILLPKGHRVTEMIAAEEHVRQLHCGPQSLLYALRNRYWPINGRSLTRKIFHKCLRCFKTKPKQSEQLMGTLPTNRVNPSKVFANTGVDYCGPFFITHSRRRGVKSTKAYVAVFVCLATKAVHLELVSDLTTDTFLGALKRFIARRGICSKIYSDNGRTFVGAKRQLGELLEFFQKESHTIMNKASDLGIQWNFIPPYAPHMGGLWEAAVKSFKHHLHRIMGTAALTYEEFSTILIQIEAVLNSRPLTPMSDEPSDFNVLTPGHFLTGGSLTAVPEPSMLQFQEGRLSRWQRVQQLLQHFWSRWSREYLNNLQQRGKWKATRPSVQVGTLVLIKDDKLPPLAWHMGRVIHLHPGKDNLTRVVTLKTISGEVTRNVHKLCVLPVEV